MSTTATASEPATSTFDYSAATLENVFIVISGLIGAGKSTLATALAKRLSLPVYYEPVTNNTYLEDFYKDTAKYSFAMQVYLLNARFKQQQEIIWGGKGGVQDRSIYEDSIFAKVRFSLHLTAHVETVLSSLALLSARPLSPISHFSLAFPADALRVGPHGEA
jgi:deoxyadenosine kinase